MRLKRLMPLFICIIVILTGCSSSVVDDKKPSCSYYTNLFTVNINNTTFKTISVYETNYSKDKILDPELHYIIKNLFESFKKENFIDQPLDIPQTPCYRYYVTFSNNETFVIDVYNEKYMSLYPWDGKYEKDFIDISASPKLYNLYGLSKYLFPRL